MKKIWKRTLALLLTVLMLGGAAPLGALSTTITAAAEDQDESILEFLQDYFFPFLYLQIDFTHEFDSSKAISPDSRFLAYMLVENVWTEFYPLSDYGESSRKRVTYPGQSFKCYRIPAAPVDYVMKQVFNLSDSAIQAMREGGAAAFAEAMQSPGITSGYLYNDEAFSYIDGYYYCFSDCLAVGGPTEEDWNIINTVQSGGYTYVIYTIEVYEDYGYGREVWENCLYYCKLKQKTAGSKSFWSLYNHSASKLPGFPGYYSCWEDAFYDFLINKKYFSSESIKDSIGRYYYDALSQHQFYTTGAANPIYASLYDFDGNGIPELIVGNDVNMQYAFDSIYGFIDGIVTYLGDAGRLYSKALVGSVNKEKFPGCFFETGYRGYYTAEYYYVKDNKLVSELIAEVSDPNGEPEMLYEYKNRVTRDLSLYSCWKQTISVYDDPFSSKKMPYYVDYRDVEDMGWEQFLLQTLDPTIYSKSLAAYAADFCAAANNVESEQIETRYGSCGFWVTDPHNYGYTTPVLGTPKTNAFCIGLKIMDNDSLVLCITARGTTAIQEGFGDFFKGGEVSFLDQNIWHNVYEFEEAVWNGLNQFVSYDWIRDMLNDAPRISILVTGHSLGGAAANAVAARIDHMINRSGGSWLDDVSVNSVYAYTFGAIKTLTSDDNAEQGYENIHNIYNYYDSWGPHGKNALLGVSSPYAKFGHTDMFSKLYDEGMLPTDMQNHDIGNYRDAIAGNLVRCSRVDEIEDNIKIPTPNLTETVPYDLEYYVDHVASTEYDPKLSYTLMSLAYAAYDKNCITTALDHLGFDTDCDEDGDGNYTYISDIYDQSADEEYLAAFSIAKKEVNGEDLVLITVRGTGNAIHLGDGKLPLLGEWLSNIFMGVSLSMVSGHQHAGFSTAAEEVWKHLKNDIYKGGEIPKNDVKFFVTGHSRGAGIANLLAVKLAEHGVSKDNVYNYNFACPDTAKDYPTSWNTPFFSDHSNMFNVCNCQDIVTFVPGILPTDLSLATAWGKYGQTGFFSFDWSDPGSTILDLTLLEGSPWTAHDQKVYLTYLRQYPSWSDTKSYMDLISVQAESFAKMVAELPGILDKMLFVDVHCPVDFQVTDDKGNLLAQVTNNVPTYFADKIWITMEDDQKTIIYFDDAPIHIKITATDNGEMCFAPHQYSFIQKELIGEKVFEHVQLTPGKTMTSTVSATAEPSTISLYVVDADDKITNIVNTNGSESPAVSISISAPFKATYKKPFTASVSVHNLPDGARIEWSSRSMRLEPSADGTLCTVTPTSTGVNSDLTATVYSADNEKLAESSTNIDVRYAWWQYLILILLFGFIWY